MKTETIKDLLKDHVAEDKQQAIVDAIMAENGKDIKKEQVKTQAAESERDKYKEQLDTAQNALKEFDGIDLEAQKKAIEDMKADIAKKEQEWKQKEEDRVFNETLLEAAREAKAKNPKLAISTLDVETLKASKNQSEDIKAAFEASKKENDYIYESDTPPPTVTVPGSTTATSTEKPASLKDSIAKRLAPKQDD